MQNNEEIANALHNISYYIDKLADAIYGENNEYKNKILITVDNFDINIEDIKNYIQKDRVNIYYIEISEKLHKILCQKDGYKSDITMVEEPGYFGTTIPRIDLSFYKVPLKINENLEDYEYKIIYFKEKED